MRNKARKQNLEKNGNGSASHSRIKELNEYRFYQDLKCECWERLFFTVKAKSYTQAKKRVKRLCKEEICPNEKNGIEVSSFEIVE